MSRSQFGLRALLVLMTVCALVAAYYGHQKYKALLANTAVEAIADVGGAVQRDKDKNVTRVLFRNAEFTDTQLKDMVPHLKNLPYLVEVDFVRTHITDKGVEDLAQVRHIKELYLFETTLTPGGIEKLDAALPDRIDVKTEAPDPMSSSMAAMTVYSHAIVALDWTPDGNLLATGSGDGTIKLWDFQKLEPVEQWKAHEDWAFALAWSRDGKTIATGGGDDVIRLWDAESRELIGELTGHTDDVHSVAFSNDSKTLVSSGDDATIRFWDLEQKKQSKILTGHTAQIPSIVISPDGKFIASASRDDTVRLWSFESGSLIQTFPTGGEFDVNTVAFDPTVTMLASGDQAGKIQVWNIASGELVQTMEGHNGKIYKIAFDNTGKNMASCGDDGVIMWDLQGQSKQALGQEYVSNLDYHPTLPWIATTSAAGEVHLLSTLTGETLAVMRTMYGERGFDFED